MAPGRRLVEERFPSGQREQTVNLPAQPSEVRILPSPPANFASEILQLKIKKLGMKSLKDHKEEKTYNTFHFFGCGSSSVVERQPSKLRVAGSNPVSRSITNFVFNLNIYS